MYVCMVCSWTDFQGNIGTKFLATRAMQLSTTVKLQFPKQFVLLSQSTPSSKAVTNIPASVWQSCSSDSVLLSCCAEGRPLSLPFRQLRAIAFRAGVLLISSRWALRRIAYTQERKIEERNKRSQPQQRLKFILPALTASQLGNADLITASTTAIVSY